jgi:SNF2 family DNA or RNA helicase
MIKLLILLRQISVHPQVYINAQRRSHPTYEREDWFGESTKTSALKKIIEDQSEKEHRWLVFAQFHDEMEIIKESLQCIPRMQRVQVYSGKQTQAQREDIIQNTKSPFSEGKNMEVLILQLHSGSVGLNLQHFDRIVFISPWWTAALMDQAVGRAVRIGQEETVEVHHLQLQEEESLNIDNLMLKAVNRKRDLCNWFLRSASRGI